MSIEIESADVIKIVLQFLKEHNLTGTLRTLQEESNVSLNMVDDLDGFISNIEKGQWPLVLKTVSNLRLSRQLQFDLFELIMFELIENNELNSARQLLYKSHVLLNMRKYENARWNELNRLIESNTLNGNNNNNNNNRFKIDNKDKRRKEICNQIKNEIFEIPPSRLLTLISQAIKYQQITGKLVKGSNYDILKGINTNKNGKNDDSRDRDEKIVRKNTCLIEFSSSNDNDNDNSNNDTTVSYPTVCNFTPDGELLVTGSNDGFIEVWDYDSGKLRSDLKCQSKDSLMLHSQNINVTAMTFSRDCELMATAAADGSIKIWRLYTGVCHCKFVKAHENAITSLEFNFDGTQILSSSLDGSVKIHGLKSKRLLKEFIGHSSFVNVSIYSYNNNEIISGSSDGTLRIWDSKSAKCQKILKNLSRLPIESSNAMMEYFANGSKNENKNNAITIENELKTNEINDDTNDSLSIRQIMVNPNCKNDKNEKNEIFVINESLTVYLINIKNGNIVRKIESSKLVSNYLTKEKTEMEKMALSSKSIGQQSYQNSFIDGCLSCRANYLYVLGQDCVVYVFSTVTAKLVHVIKVHENDVLGIIHHPHRNILASYSKDRSLKIWRP